MNLLFTESRVMMITRSTSESENAVGQLAANPATSKRRRMALDFMNFINMSGRPAIKVNHLKN